MSALEEIKKRASNYHNAIPDSKLDSIEWAIYYASLDVRGEVSAIRAAAELSALRAEVEALKASNARLFDDLHNQIHQTVGAEMERDELREQVADVNELLWEFTENPNIELGEVGHNKIEDYFKKYSSNV